MGLFMWLVMLLAIAWGLADFLLDTARHQAPPPMPPRKTQAARPEPAAPAADSVPTADTPADPPQGAKE